MDTDANNKSLDIILSQVQDGEENHDIVYRIQNEARGSNKLKIIYLDKVITTIETNCQSRTNKFEKGAASHDCMYVLLAVV